MIVVIGILAAVAIPQVSLIRAEGRDQSGINTLHGVRTALASFRARSVIEGTGPFPTYEEFMTPGVVLDRDIGPNPWTGVEGVRQVSRFDAAMRNAGETSLYGWSFFVDNTPGAPVVVFFANCTDTTQRINASTGEPYAANEL